MVTEDEVTEITETPEVEQIEETEVVEPVADTEQEEVAQALQDKENEFTADYKFSSYGTDHEIPEWARVLIKDEETQNTVKEVFNKATSFDTFKEKDEKRAKTLEELQTNYDSMNTGVAAVKEAIQQNNWDKFIKTSGIDENWIYKQVLDKVNYNEASPEEQARIDAQRSADSRFHDLEAKARELETQNQESLLQAKRYELDMALAKPEVQEYVNAFDAAPGKQPGAFRELVLDQAELAWNRSGGKVDMPLETAVNQAMSLLGNGFLTPSHEPQGEKAQNQVITETPQTQPTAKTVIPNVKGRASDSPLKGQAAKSIKDLKKLYNDRYAKQLA